MGAWVNLYSALVYTPLSIVMQDDGRRCNNYVRCTWMPLVGVVASHGLRFHGMAHTLLLLCTQHPHVSRATSLTQHLLPTPAHLHTPHPYPHPTPVPTPTRHVCFFTVASSRADLLSYNAIVNKVIYAWLDRSPCLPVNTFTKQTESTGMVTKTKPLHEVILDNQCVKHAAIWLEIN